MGIEEWREKGGVERLIRKLLGEERCRRKEGGVERLRRKEVDKRDGEGRG